MAKQTQVDLDACREVAGTCPRNLLQRVAHEAGRRFQAGFDQHGISGQQFSLMVGISLHPEPTVVRLAELRRLDQTTMSRNIQVMVDMGLVKSQPSAADGRVRVIRLAARGCRTLNAALVSWRAVRDEFVGTLGQERSQQLMALLRETADALEGDAP
jgi:DNA-binding MarR family transcriptional regulator